MIKSFLYYPPNVNLCFRLFFSKKLIAYQHGFNIYKIYTEKSITFFCHQFDYFRRNNIFTLQINNVIFFVYDSLIMVSGNRK